MPSSTEKVLTLVVQNIMQAKPKSVLDVGSGFGKWGFLCREYLETWNDRITPEEWQVQVDAIEIFVPYINLPWIKTVYDTVHRGDASVIIDKLDNYDLIIANDVIEHLPKDRGLHLLEGILTKSKTAIINIPLGECWLNNKIVGGNINEKHLSVWFVEELLEIGKKFNKQVISEPWDGVKGRGLLIVYKEK